MREERIRTVVESQLQDSSDTLFVDLPGLGQHWTRFGGTALPPDGTWPRIVLRLPKGRDTLRVMLHLLAARLAPDGVLWVVGANDEGIKSSNKTVSELFASVETLDTRRKCRLWQARDLTVEPRTLESFYERVESDGLSFDTLPGLFAHGRLDAATQLLLANVEKRDGRILDFGCGSGPISLALGAEGIDHDAWAVHCAQHNGVDAKLSNGWSAVTGPFDQIVSNPPFHSGKDTDFSVMFDLLMGAKERLKTKGRLTFVCPRTAPVMPRLKKAWSKVELKASSASSAVWEVS